MKNNTNKYILISTILLQSVLVIMSNISILGASSLEELKASTTVFHILIIITTFLVFLSLKQVNYYDEKDVELKLLKSNMEQIEGLINVLRSQRHDYLTHMQAIGAMAYLEEYHELKQYLKEISSEYRHTSELIRIGDPALTALINTKKEIAAEKNILFYVKCKTKIRLSKISSWELCSLFSNLIENAMEACIGLKYNKWIKVTINSNDNDLIIEVENSGQIEGDIIFNIFEPGTTSKGSAGRGFGLYICKRIVEKYEGTIGFENTSKGTVKFTVNLPKGDFSYDKKIS